MKYKNVSDLTLDDLNGESLEHYGIPGQKWGVRRYQNEDGTLTEAGKKRYGEEGPSRGEKSGRKHARDITNALNRLDQNRAENAYKIEKHQNSIDRLGRKIEKRGAKGKDTSSLSLKKEKSEMRLANSAYKKGYDQSSKAIQSYLDIARKEGYRINEKRSVRYVDRGQLLIGNLLVGGAIGGALNAALATKRAGTYYRVKAPKED